MDVEIPKKRGRGRPKKVLPIVNSITALIEDEEPTANEIIPLACLATDEEEAITLVQIPDEKEETLEVKPYIPSPMIEPMVYHMPVATFTAPEVPQGSLASRTAKPAPTDDREDRRQLIDKIKKYRQGFDAARALPFHEEMETEKLRALLDDIRLSISSRNTSLIFRSGYLTAVKGCEIVGTKVGMRCYGLADALGKSAEVADLLREIEAEVGIKYISPWKRLAFVTVSTAVILDGMNRRAETLASFKSEPVSPVLDDRYKDL